MTRVYLHIGAPKTGTTYLQAVLFRNRDRLRAAGVLYPGTSADAHFRATLDVRGLTFGGYDDPATDGAWRQLVKTVRDWPGESVVLSHELLGGSPTETIESLLADLAHAEVHVVCTARDFGRQVPAVWQEMVKNRRDLTYETYLAQVTGARKGRGAKVFWRQQDIAGVLARWSQLIPPQRVHLVTVPPAGAPSGLLWVRFCAAVGLDAEVYDTEAPRTNASLGLAEGELVRRVNESLGDRLEWPDHARLVKGRLAERLLAQRPGAGRAEVPDELRGWFDAAADELVADLAGRGYDVVGDLDELRPRYGKAGAAAAPTEGAVADAAAYALAELLVEQSRRRRGGTCRFLTRASRLPWLRGDWLPGGWLLRIRRFLPD